MKFNIPNEFICDMVWPETEAELEWIKKEILSFWLILAHQLKFAAKLNFNQPSIKYLTSMLRVMIESALSRRFPSIRFARSFHWSQRKPTRSNYKTKYIKLRIFLMKMGILLTKIPKVLCIPCLISFNQKRYC